jgi:Uma2 family endonuclease
MTVITREPDALDILLRDFLSLDTPEGYRAQLIDGEIVVTPPPGGNHERCISRIVRQVLSKSAAPMDFSANKGLNIPAVAGQNMVIPGLTFAPDDLDLFLDAPSWMPPAGVAMVVEVTSSMPERDRDAKRRAYAAARIPLYLLVDREQKRTVLYSAPVRRDYASTTTAPFGESLTLPDPFSFTLETAGFVA